MRRLNLLPVMLCVSVALGAQSITQDYNRYANMLNQERSDQQRREQQAQYDKAARDNQYHGSSGSGGSGSTATPSGGGSTAAGDLAGAGLNTLNNINDRMKARAAQRQAQEKKAKEEAARRAAENKKIDDQFDAYWNSSKGRAEQAQRDLNNGRLDAVMKYVDWLYFGPGNDKSAGIEWAQKIADKGNVDAQERVGLHYAAGITGAQDFVKAKPYLEKCSAAQRLRCHVWLAQIALSGEKVDYETARRYGKLATQQSPDDPWAAMTYFNALTSSQNADRQEAFRIVKHQADLLAQNAPLADDGTKVAYREYRQRLAEQAAAMYFSGYAGSKDEATAMKMLQQQADIHGSPAAMYELGKIYHAGSETVAKDEAKSIDYYRKSAVTGYPRALRAMAFRELEGSGVPKNEKEGRELARLAAAKGDEDAYFLYAQTLYYGLGGPKDRDTAIAWLVKSALELHDKDSAKMLMEEKVTPDEIARAKTMKLDLSTEAHQ